MTDIRHRGEIALVTGANKGIGREITRRLAAEGMTVYLGARDQTRGRSAAQELSGLKASASESEGGDGKDGADVRYIHLDVTDQADIDAAAKRIAEESGRLDVLVNNAGIGVEWGYTPLEVTADQMRQTYEVNVFGVVTVTRAFLPLLRRSSAPRIVNLSSPLGSLQMLADPDSDVAQVGLLAYSSSKSALNSITLLHANALRKEGVLVNAANPGYVATDLNDHRGTLTVEEGAEIPLKLALLGPDGPTGTFLGNSNGADQGVPW